MCGKGIIAAQIQGNQVFPGVAWNPTEVRVAGGKGILRQLSLSVPYAKCGRTRGAVKKSAFELRDSRATLPGALCERMA